MDKLKEYIIELIQEYTGTGAGGGNATDGNDITSPRPFADDMSEIENYIFKNVYGGEGGHYRKDQYNGNYPNRHKTTMFENEDQVREYIRNEIRSYYGVHDTYGASPRQKRNLSGFIGVQEQMDPGKQAEFTRRKIDLQKDLAQVDIEMTREQLKAISAQTQQATSQISQQIAQTEQQLQDAIQQKRDQTKQIIDVEREISDLEEDEEITPDLKKKRREELDKELSTARGSLEGVKDQIIQFKKTKDQLFGQQAQNSANASQQVKQIRDQIRQQTKAMNSIGKTQPGQAMREYFKDTQSNLMERMDSYRKEAKRNILMEGVMKTFFEMFDNGMTNEEIIQDYASKGTQVPETFVGTARKQYETYKKMKLELDMSEKEFKNSAKEIVNNPEMMERDSEEKQLASGLFKEEILKKQIIKELNKIK
tara:strand:+ start:878 stop:2146 length:1269 start_codon:yes stop_codon:yes gene_type:complete